MRLDCPGAPGGPGNPGMPDSPFSPGKEAKPIRKRLEAAKKSFCLGVGAQNHIASVSQVKGKLVCGGGEVPLMLLQLSHWASSSVSTPHFVPVSFCTTTECGSKFQFYTANSTRQAQRARGAQQKGR